MADKFIDIGEWLEMASENPDHSHRCLSYASAGFVDTRRQTPIQFGQWRTRLRRNPALPCDLAEEPPG